MSHCYLFVSVWKIIIMCKYDPRLEQIRYTGTFSLEQDIMDVFRIIDYEKQFAFKRVKRDIFITHK